jgi:intracellular sulfur oxidation DsrE/DsrF family protein
MLAVQLVGREEEKVIIACQRTVELATHTPKAHTEKKKVTACVHRVNSSTSDVVTLENEQYWLIRLAVSSSLLAVLREIIHFRGSSIDRTRVLGVVMQRASVWRPNAAAERTTWQGLVSARAYVVVCQTSLLRPWPVGAGVRT